VKTSGHEVSPDCAATDTPILTRISAATAALRSVLYGSATASPAAVDTSLPISLSALALAFAAIARARDVLHAGTITEPELMAAIAEYQRLLREFKSNLPRFQGWLLAQRAHLARRGSHSAAFESWIETNWQTRKANWPGHPKR
jgi:hypothetical protein